MKIKEITRKTENSRQGSDNQEKQINDIMKNKITKENDYFVFRDKNGIEIYRESNPQFHR